MLSRFSRKNKKTKSYQRNYEQVENEDLNTLDDINIDMNSGSTFVNAKQDKTAYYENLLREITDEDKEGISQIAQVSTSLNDTFRRMEQAGIPLEYLVALGGGEVTEIDIESYQNIKVKGLEVQDMVDTSEIEDVDETLKAQTFGHMDEMPELKNTTEEIEQEDDKDDYQKAVEHIANNEDKEDSDSNTFMSFSDDEDETETNSLGFSTSIEEYEKDAEDDNPFVSFSETENVDTDEESTFNSYSNEEKSNDEETDNKDFAGDNVDWDSFSSDEDDEEDEDEWDLDDTDEEENSDTSSPLDTEENEQGEDNNEEDEEVLKEALNKIRGMTEKLRKPAKDHKSKKEQSEYDKLMNELDYGEDEESLEQENVDEKEQEEYTDNDFISFSEEQDEQEEDNKETDGNIETVEESTEITKKETPIYKPKPKPKPKKNVYLIADNLLTPVIEGYNIIQVKEVNQLTQYTSSRNNLMIITQHIPKEIQKVFLEWLNSVNNGSKKYRIVTLRGQAVSFELIETEVDLTKESLDAYYEEYNEERYKGKDVDSFLDISSYIQNGGN